MTSEKIVKGKKVHICDVCGFGYKDEVTAQECQSWCGEHKTCNLKITKNAVYFPKSKSF